MAPSELTSTKRDPKELYITALILTVLAIAGDLLYENQPDVAPKSIKWRTISQARVESLHTHKPVMYVFSANWCTPCKRMESVAFGRRNIAGKINKSYVPVLVIDETQEKGKNTPAVTRVQKQCNVTSFPTMCVVPWNLLDGNDNDIFSTGSSIERNLVSQNMPFLPDNTPSEAVSEPSEVSSFDMMDYYRNRVPVHVGYSTPEDISDYLYRCNMWHRLPPTKGMIHWESMPEPKTVGKLPTMIAFVEDCGAISDKMRLSFFDNTEASSLINEHFKPVLIEVSKEEPTEEAIAMKKRFSITALPALVVLYPGEKPIVQDGFTSKKHAIQFLNRCLVPKN